MRSVLALTVALSVALISSRVGAAELVGAQPRVSVETAEGRAILLKVRALTRRLHRISRPIVLPNPVHYGLGDRDRAVSSGDGFASSAPPLAVWQPSSRDQTRQDSIAVGGTLATKLLAERSALIRRLDTPPAELARLIYR